MGCGSSSTKKGGELSNNVVSNSHRPPAEPYIPPRPEVPYVQPRHAPPKASYKPPPTPPKQRQANPATQGLEIDFNPQVGPTNTAAARTVRSSLQQHQTAAERSSQERPIKEKSPREREHKTSGDRKERSSKERSSKDKAHRSKERRERKERENFGGQGHTASLSLQAAQQQGPVVDHRKTSYTPPYQPPNKSVPPPEPVSVPEPVKASPPPEVTYSPPSAPVPQPAPEPTRAVVVASPPPVKKNEEDKKQSRIDYDRVQSNKGIKMSDIPQPDSKSGLPFSTCYRLKGVLGTGAFSTVREGTHKSNKDVTYAVKCVTRAKLSEEDEAALLDEVSILKEMNHIHIIRLYDFFPEPSTYYLVMERMSGGELFDRIVAKAYYNEKEARDTCKILLEAVGYCHENSVAHRDLKPENLLLRSEEDDSAVKIADFGFAKKVLEPRSLQTQCGTPGYVAPEILEGVPYDTKSDMWSVGVILYILLGGYPPFIENNQRDLFRKIRRGEYEFHDEYWGTVSTGAKDLISSLLTVDPDVRLDAHQALDNAWIRQDDESLEKKDLGVNLEEFRKFNAKRKFKAAVSTVLAVNKLQSLGKDFLKSLQD